MTKQKKQSRRSSRFEKAVQDMINAGELNPTEADEKSERAMEKVVQLSKPKN